VGKSGAASTFPQPESDAGIEQAGRGQGNRGMDSPPGDVSEMLADAKAVELLADESRAGKTLRPVGLSEPVSMLQELASDPFGLGEAIGDALGEDVPDGDEQLAGDGDDGLVASQAGLEALELGFPVRVAARRSPGRFNHNEAQVAATSLGDLAGAGGLAGVVAALLATVISLVLSHYVLKMPLHWNYSVWLYGFFGGAIGVGLFGVVGSLQVIKQPPLVTLKKVVISN